MMQHVPHPHFHNHPRLPLIVVWLIGLLLVILETLEGTPTDELDCY